MNYPDPDLILEARHDAEMTENPDPHFADDGYVDDRLEDMFDTSYDDDLLFAAVVNEEAPEAATDGGLDELMRIRTLLLGTIDRRTRRHARQTVAVKAIQARLDAWLARETDARKARVVELERAIEERVSFLSERFGRNTFSGPWGTVKVVPADKRTDWVWPTKVGAKAALCAQLADIDAGAFVRTKTIQEPDALAVKKHAIAKDGHVWLNGEQLVEVTVPGAPKVEFK